jgi:hypothetical protein
MRYSYIEIFVEHSAAAADLRYEADDYYGDGSWDPHWYDAEEGLSFHFDEADDNEIRLGHIRIPEAHPLFNFGIIEKTQFARVMPFPRELYLEADEYARNILTRAGIPMTVYEAMKYDDENQ